MNILNQTGQLDKLKRHQLGVIIFVLKKEEGVLSCWLKKHVVGQFFYKVYMNTACKTCR